MAALCVTPNLPYGASLKHRKMATIASFLTLALTAVTPPSLAGSTERNGRLSLSPELAVLLKAEMGELSEGIRAIALSLAKADWEVLEATSEKMYESYIMKKSLTPALAAVLKQELPPAFKRLDAEFHTRALKLQHAAEVRDLELSAFHFSKLVESCASCHAVYAAERFTGFNQRPQERQEH